jgi:hypothetical protein
MPAFAPPDRVQALNRVLVLYARRGIDDWKNAPTEIKRRAMECLGTTIAERDSDANEVIHEGASKNLFIPMPRQTRGLLWCFFLPVRERHNGELHVSFELVLIVTLKKSLGFRFEPADKQGTHQYGHVQFNRRMLRGQKEISGIPSWIPDSYPAFVSSSDPLRMFLSMVTAIHGYSAGVANGIGEILKHIFSRESDARAVAAYLQELRELAS